jgi:hypothetical protein
MYQRIYPALFCATAVLYAAPATSNTEATEVQPFSSVVIQHNISDWKQANQKVAELGGWQFYASEGGGHQGMDHSKHSMPMDHSKHSPDTTMDHSGHSIPMDHSKHSSDDTMDHSGHSMPTDHSKHHNHQQMDHSEHQRAKTGDEHEHHH